VPETAYKRGTIDAATSNPGSHDVPFRPHAGPHAARTKASATHVRNQDLVTAPPLWILLSICCGAILFTGLAIRLFKIAPDGPTARFLLVGLACVAVIKFVLSPLLLYHLPNLGDDLLTDPRVLVTFAAVLTFLAYGLGLWVIARPALRRVRRLGASDTPPAHPPSFRAVAGYTLLACALWFVSYFITIPFHAAVATFATLGAPYFIAKGGFLSGDLALPTLLIYLTIVVLAIGIRSFLLVLYRAEINIAEHGRPLMITGLLVSVIVIVAIYHGVWLAFMLAGIGVWPLDMSQTK
jgi:hypothetical protein